jgi:hypothetical protein
MAMVAVVPMRPVVPIIAVMPVGAVVVRAAIIVIIRPIPITRPDEESEAGTVEAEAHMPATMIIASFADRPLHGGVLGQRS